MTVHDGQATLGGAGTFSSSGAKYSYLAPDADSVDGSWMDRTGGTSLFDSVDELSIDDTDFIASSKDPLADVCKIRLSDPGVTPDMPFIVQYRYRKTGEGQINLKVRLLQGNTEIAAWSHPFLSSSFVSAEQALTSAQFAAISDFNDLFLEFNANPFQGAGDVVGSALAWWGLRAYTVASIGNNAIRLRRSSDNAESNFVTVTGGGLDLDTPSTGIKAWGAGSTLYVVKLYDQSGNAVDVLQATAGAQPVFSIDPLAIGLPAIIGASGKILSSSATITQAQPFSGSGVFFVDSGNETAPNTIFNQSSPNCSFYFNPSSSKPRSIGIYDGAASFTSWGPVSSNKRVAACAIWGSLGTRAVFLYGYKQEEDGSDVGGNGLSSTVDLMAYNSTTYNLVGYFMEWGIWSGTLSDVQMYDLNVNEMVYWQISDYVGPGDVVEPNAASPVFWCGLRAYSRGATGLICVRLRRSSDNAESDFKTNELGSLDQSAIVVWRDAVGAASAYIVNLYDQSHVTTVNNNFVQNVASVQPLFVVNGVGNNPVLRFESARTTYMISAGGIPATQPFTFSHVVSRTANFTSTSWVAWQTTTSVKVRYKDQPNRFEILTSKSFDASIYDSAMQSVFSVFNGANSNIQINGFPSYGDVGTDSLTAQFIYLGESDVGAPFSDGDLAEFGLWESALTSANMTNLYANQKSYGNI